MLSIVQNLKYEVEWMGSMAHCMDAFLKTHTRLVVIVDGLDSCEQEKLLQVSSLVKEGHRHADNGISQCFPPGP